MTEILQPEDSCPADAWIEPVSVKHKIDHSDIERMTAAFLAGGSTITEVESGLRMDPPRRPKDDRHDAETYAALVAHGDVNPYLLPEQKAKLDKIHAGDSDLVAHIAVRLPTKPDRKALLSELQCTDCKLQRLLRMYFREDTAADYLRKKHRPLIPTEPRPAKRRGAKPMSQERRKEIADQLRQAAEMGMNKTTARHHVGVNHSFLEELSIEFNLTFPKTINRKLNVPTEELAQTIKVLASTACLRQIAKETGIDPTIIRRVADQFGIELKDGRAMRKQQEAA